MSGNVYPILKCNYLLLYDISIKHAKNFFISPYTVASFFLRLSRVFSNITEWKHHRQKNVDVNHYLDALFSNAKAKAL